MPAESNNPGIPIVCYVTERRGLAARDPAQGLLERISAAAAAGVDWVQIREKDLSAAALASLVREALKILQAANQNTRLIVNDRLDAAWPAGAGGIHLGRESLPVAEVFRWRAERGKAAGDFRIGASCHHVDEAKEAEGQGADYIFFGPVFDSPAKRAFGPPLGTAALAAACQAVRIPVIAIGGVHERNAAECSRAGARGFAAIRMFQDVRGAADLAAAVKHMHGVEAETKD